MRRTVDTVRQAGERLMQLDAPSISKWRMRRNVFGNRVCHPKTSRARSLNKLIYLKNSSLVTSRLVNLRDGFQIEIRLEDRYQAVVKNRLGSPN